MVYYIIFKIVYEYNETTVQVQEYRNLLILIECCDERCLHVKIYYCCYHNIRLMSKRRLCIKIFTAFLKVLGLSMYVLMSHGRLLKIYHIGSIQRPKLLSANRLNNIKHLSQQLFPEHIRTWPLYLFLYLGFRVKVTNYGQPEADYRNFICG
jgi:hypothetical protein